MRDERRIRDARRGNPLHLEDDEARDLERLKSLLPCERDEISALICTAQRVSHFEQRGFIDEGIDWAATARQFALVTYRGQGRQIKKLHLSAIGSNALRLYYRHRARRL